MSTMRYAQVDGLLAHAFEVPSEFRHTFASRLKQFQKMGFPVGVRVTRGVKTEYTEDHLYQLAVCLELCRLGMFPEKAIDVVQRMWPTVRAAIDNATPLILKIGGWTPYLGAPSRSSSGIRIDTQALLRALNNAGAAGEKREAA